MDLKAAQALLVIFAVVGLLILIADAIIFFRWLIYHWAKINLEEKRYREALAREPQVRADEPVPLGYDLPQAPQPQQAWRPAAPADAAASAELTRPDVQRPAESRSLAAPEFDPEMPRYPFAHKWSLVDAFLAFQVALLVGNLVPGLALIPVIGLNPDALYSAPSIIIQLLILVFGNGVFVAVTAFCVNRYGLSLAKIGLAKPTTLQVATGVGIGIILFLLASGIELGTRFGLQHTLSKSALDALVKLNDDLTAGGLFEKISSFQLKVAFAIAGTIAAPIGEEVFFRGLLYNSLKHRLNVTAAIVLSGLVFALIHLGPLAVIGIFPMGMALAYVYEKTRSLWVTICMHATNNGLALVLALAFPHLGEAPKEPVRPAPPPVKREQRAVPGPGRRPPAPRRSGAPSNG
jgi:membrane protease YdiL (CAAX protease family)